MHQTLQAAVPGVDGAQSDEDASLRRADFWLLSGGGGVLSPGGFWKFGTRGYVVTVLAFLCFFGS